MDVNKTARIQCSEISGSFWTGLYATRKCLDGGVWDGVDVSQCTIKDTNEIPFIVYSTYLQLLDNSSLSTLNQVNIFVISSEHNSTSVIFIISFNNHLMCITSMPQLILQCTWKRNFHLLVQ